MPVRRRPEPTPTLDALTGAERGAVLAELLAAHPDLQPDAELAAEQLLANAAIDTVAEEVAWALREIPIEDLAGRCGRIRGRGYVDENEAAWELVHETIEPFLTDVRRRAGLGLADAAAAIAAGIAAGVYQVRDPEDGTVVAYAGPDTLNDLVDEVINEATRLGLALPEGAADRYWAEWS